MARKKPLFSTKKTRDAIQDAHKLKMQLNAGQISEAEFTRLKTDVKQDYKTGNRPIKNIANAIGIATGAYFLAAPAWAAVKGIASGTGGLSKLAGLAKSAGGWASLLKGLGLAGGAYGAGRGVQEARDYAKDPLSGADQASQGTMQDLQARLLQELGGSDVSPAVAEMYSEQEPRIAGTMWNRGLIGSSAHGVALSDLAKRSYLAGEQIRRGRQTQATDQLRYLGGELGEFRGQENAARQQYIQGLSGLAQLGAGVYNYASGLPEEPQVGPSESELRAASSSAGAPPLPARFSQPPPGINQNITQPPPGYPVVPPVTSPNVPAPTAAGLRFLAPPPPFIEEPVL